MARSLEKIKLVLQVIRQILIITKSNHFAKYEHPLSNIERRN